MDEKLRLKILAGTIENTLIRFNDEEFLTLGKILYPNKFSELTVITHGEKSRKRDIYYECSVCNYKTLILDDYNEFFRMCCWDFSFCDDNGRYKFNRDLNGHKMTLQQGREYFKKYGISKASKLSEVMFFERWLHDLAITQSHSTDFFKYRTYMLKHCAKQ